MNSSKYAAYAYYYGIPYTTGFKNTTEIYSLPVALHYTFTEHAVQPYVYAGVAAAYKSINFASTFFDKGLQGKYGLSMLGGVGIEVYPVKFIAIKADWRYELLMQYPTLGVALRF